MLRQQLLVVLIVLCSSPVVCYSVCNAGFVGSDIAVVYDVPYSGHSYSSIHGGYDVGEQKGKGRLDSDVSWTALTNDQNQYMQLDLGAQYPVYGVATKGRNNVNQHVKTYRVTVSTDGSTWVDVDGGATFSGKHELSSNYFATPPTARYVRIRPVSWYGWISMRAGVIVQGVVPTGLTDVPYSGHSYSSIHGGYDVGEQKGKGRLDSDVSWTALTNDQNQYMQLDLGAQYPVYGVATKGRNNVNQHVKTYRVTVSTDGSTWVDVDGGATFSGKHELSFNYFATPPTARYVRIRPVSWYGWISMRAGVIMLPSGLADVPYSGHSYSSIHGGYDVGEQKGKGRLDSDVSWTALTNDQNQYMQLDLGAQYPVYGVATKGRNNVNQHVKTYRVTVSTDGSTWVDVDGGATFSGKHELSSNYFATPPTARYVRIRPVSWYGWISLRAGVILCSDADECAASTDDCENSVCSNTQGSFTCSCNAGFEPLDQSYAGGTVDVEYANGGHQYSSVWGTGGNGVGSGNARGRLDSTQSWTAETNDVNQWMQLDLGSPMAVEGVSSKGRYATDPGTEQWVTTYTVTYSFDGNTWTEVDSGATFSGNSDRDSLVSAYFGSAVAARYVRIHPATWKNHISMRAGLILLPQQCSEVDECGSSAHDCDADASCTDNYGSFTCSCNTGFVDWSTGSIGTSCDEDQCSSETHDCSSEATCTDAEDGVTCSCNDGWVGDGVSCTNVDECFEQLHDCDADAACTDNDGSFTCTCNTGFADWSIGKIGTSCEEDQCSTFTHNCDVNGECSDNDGGFSCSCNSGFRDWNNDGTYCTLDECATGAHNCDANAACHDEENGFACSCNAGFADWSEGQGTSCEENQCLTGTHDCDADASCTDSDGSFTCSCENGLVDWSTGSIGTSCDEDQCSTGTADCSLNATCTDTKDGFDCKCNAGFKDWSMDQRAILCDLDECTTGAHDCDNSLVCIDQMEGFLCLPPADWSVAGEEREAQPSSAVPSASACAESATTPWLLSLSFVLNILQAFLLLAIAYRTFVRPRQPDPLPETSGPSHAELAYSTSNPLKRSALTSSPTARWSSTLASGPLSEEEPGMGRSPLAQNDSLKTLSVV